MCGETASHIHKIKAEILTPHPSYVDCCYRDRQLPHALPFAYYDPCASCDLSLPPPWFLSLISAPTHSQCQGSFLSLSQVSAVSPGSQDYDSAALRNPLWRSSP